MPHARPAPAQPADPIDNDSDDTSDTGVRGGSPNRKLQRWIDLIAELLSRSSPASFEDIARGVPEYARKLERAGAMPDDEGETAIASLKRAFERDKDELRALGVDLESVPDGDGNSGGRYRLRRTKFYLPYLCFAVPSGARMEPVRIDRYGYQALTSLTFDADELQAVVDAGRIVRALGNPLLAADVASAMRKLAVDLPIDAVAAGSTEPSVLLPRPRPDATIFETLGDALARRKQVTFAYRAMSTGRTERRETEPYGLFFLNGHWYLAARDRTRDALRNFRLNRITDVEVNGKRASSADYEVPATFRLREHARSRHAWELGDGDATPVLVDFVGESGATMAARRLGAPVDGDDRQRAFEVRRPDAFVRWLLSFAGEVVPRSPSEIVAAYAGEIEATRHAHAGTLPAADVPPSPSVEGDEEHDAAAPAETWQPKGAAAQLRRILHVVPLIADGETHEIADVAARIGTDAEMLRRDLFSLVSRFDVPGGFVEGVQLFVESERVSAESDHFLRPMRLTVSELCALELGLAVLRTRRPPDEHALLERARERLRGVISRLGDDPLPDGLHGASLGDHGSIGHLATIRDALRLRQRLRLTYRKSGSAASSVRTVSPYGLVAANGMLYLIANGEEGARLRIFRLDRVEDAELLPDPYEMPPDVSIEDVVRDGRIFQHPEPANMRIRYSPRVARWIAEREGRTPAADGSLVIDHPLVEWEWGMRHVLQYGPDAEIVAPDDFRAALLDRLASMRGSMTAGMTAGMTDALPVPVLDD